MKHQSLYISIERKEDGYQVTRQKHIYPKYEKACILTMLEEAHKWANKKSSSYGERVCIDIIGNGTDKCFHQVSIMRFIDNGDDFRVVWFGEKQTGEGETFTKKREALKRFDDLYKEKIADFIDYQEEA
jgi:hypothetical protein